MSVFATFFLTSVFSVQYIYKPYLLFDVPVRFTYISWELDFAVDHSHSLFLEIHF